MNIRSWAGSLCLLALPLAATATEPAASPFPDRPYLLQFKRSLPATSPTPSAPGRGMTPSLSMGPGGSCNAEYTGDCERVDIGGAGWEGWGTFAAINQLERVELTIKRSERKAALCTVELMECRLYLIPSEVGAIDRGAPAQVLSFFSLEEAKVLNTCIRTTIASKAADPYDRTATAAAEAQLEGKSYKHNDQVDVAYLDGSVWRFNIYITTIGHRFSLEGGKQQTKSKSRCAD